LDFTAVIILDFIMVVITQDSSTGAALQAESVGLAEFTATASVDSMVVKAADFTVAAVVAAVN
jgi:hypothetical protein